MRSVTNLVPASGVLSSFDERATAVVDTLSDTWHYFTGDRAWAWQAVHVTGNLNALEDEEIAYVAEFMDHGLIIKDDEESRGSHFSAWPPDFHLDDVEDIEIPEEHTFRKEVSRAWSTTKEISKSPLSHTLGTLRYAHEEGFPFASVETTREVWRRVSQSMPWWFSSRHHTQKNITLATVLALHRLGARSDFAFGMSHRTRKATFWCATPEGDVGRKSECLPVGAA